MKNGISEKSVEEYLRRHPGSTQKQIAAAFPTGDAIYGSHKFVASIITKMRKAGKIADVERCDKCHRALTRGRRNLPLTLL